MEVVYLADEAARHFERVLEEAASSYEHVVAVTHVPPDREAAWYQGKTSSDDFRIQRNLLLCLCGHGSQLLQRLEFH